MVGSGLLRGVADRLHVPPASAKGFICTISSETLFVAATSLPRSTSAPGRYASVSPPSFLLGSPP